MTLCSSKGKKITTYCRMCNDRCCINVYLKDGRIVDVEGYPNHPWNKGKVCIKSRAAIDILYHPKRLSRPLKKTLDGWKEIPLGQAFKEIAEKVNNIKTEYGARSVAIWKGEAVGFNQQEDYARRFCHAFGTPNYFSNDSQCFIGKDIGHRLVDGVWAVPDYAHTKFIIQWGANPPKARPMMTRMMLDAKRKGAKLVVVDPRLTEMARQADIFIQIRPGTDGAFAWGIINLIIKNKWYDQNFVENYTVGFQKLARYAKKYSPKYVEHETGVHSAKLYAVAKGFAMNAPMALNYVGNGLEHHENGINNIRAVACIGALCGCLDQKGGEFIPEGLGARSLRLYKEIPLKHLKPIGADKFPVTYEFTKECHSMTGINTIISGKPYPIKAMIMTAANPVLTNPNSDKVKKAFENLDLLVVHDLFTTETTKYAHYILPAAMFFERTELVEHSMFQRVGLAQRILRCFPDCTDEYEFWSLLAQKLGIGEYFPWENETEVNRWLLGTTNVTLEQLEENPEGIEFKNIRYQKYLERKRPFNTPSGKVEFASQYLKDLGYPELPEYHPPAYILTPDKKYPYVLVTGARSIFYSHSRNHNIPRFRQAEPSPCAEMHPDDAKKLKIKDGETVRISSIVGSVDIPIKIMDNVEILPGVIQVTHGWKEADVNQITPDLINDPIDGFPLMKSLAVNIEKIG